MPSIAACMRRFCRNRSQKGTAPITSRNDGAKIATRHSKPPDQPDGPACIDAPRNAAKVNKGPGIACVTPYPARKVSLLTQPTGTTSAWSNGNTTWPPPNTSDPLR
ncbi:hypothetical protein D3C77_341490 [compost metagenome]